MKTQITFGMLLFPAITQLDLTGPAEVFSRVDSFDLHLVSKTRAPVPTSAGWMIVPTASFDDAPQYDVICVPGGGGQIALMDDLTTLEFVRRQAEGAQYVTSVCTGALVLGAAGLLRGYRAACHWMSRDQLALLGAIPVVDRVVIDRNRITCGGVTSGIDFGLIVVAELCGARVAQEIQLDMEYDPHPPFNCGRPEQASPETLNSVIQKATTRQAIRLAATKRAANRLGRG